jgi:hypothetical protein
MLVGSAAVRDHLRRRRDRIRTLFAALHLGRDWHKAALTDRVQFVRFWGDCVAKLFAAPRAIIEPG